MSERADKKARIKDLLHRLNSAEAGVAWAEFLDRYAQHIMNVAGQIEFEPDRVEDCFLYVCEKLNEHGFRRLLKFNPTGPAKFKTWLTTVTFNLCVDWHRREFGRVRMLPAISALPEFDRSVYRLVIEQGTTRESAFQRLRTEFPDLTRESMSKALIRIHKVLTPRQRWQISVRQRSSSTAREEFAEWQIESLRDSAAGPDVGLQEQEKLEILERALSSLTLDQRLLIYWRFQEGLSLKRISRLAGLGNVNRTWSHIQQAIAALSDQVHESRSSKDQNF